MKFLKKLWAAFEYIGRIRAAGIYARDGQVKAAHDLMNKKFI